MTPTVSTTSEDHKPDKASTAVTVAFLALFISVLNSVGVLVCMFRESIVTQTQEVNVERPQTGDELMNERVRETMEAMNDTTGM